MDAILAIIADGGRAIIEIYREAVEIICFSFNLQFNTKPFEGDLGQPLPQRRPGWGTLVQQNHAAGEENGSIMVVVFVICVFR